MGNELQLLVVLGAIRDDENRILVAKRVDASIPAAYGKWEFPGGKVDFGEVPEQALYRELEEEAGLKVEMQRLLPKLFTNTCTGKNNFLPMSHQSKNNS
jgi:8-oxo-dGTP diphosphatase